MARATDLYRESMVELMERVRHPPVGEQPPRQLHAAGVVEILTVYEGNCPFDGGLRGHHRPPKRITPSEASRRVGRGATAY